MKAFEDMTFTEKREFWADVGRRVGAMLPPPPAGRRHGFVLVAVALHEDGWGGQMTTVQATDLLPNEATRALRQVLGRVSKAEASDYELPPVRPCAGCRIGTSGVYPEEALAGGVPTCGKLKCTAAAKAVWEASNQ